MTNLLGKMIRVILVFIFSASFVFYFPSTVGAVTIPASQADCAAGQTFVPTGPGNYNNAYCYTPSSSTTVHTLPISQADCAAGQTFVPTGPGNYNSAYCYTPDPKYECEKDDLHLWDSTTSTCIVGVKCSLNGKSFVIVGSQSCTGSDPATDPNAYPSATTPEGTTVWSSTPSGTSRTTTGNSNNTCDSPRFLTFPPWYRGLNVGTSSSSADCEIANPEAVGGLSIFIWRIALNVIEIMLQAVAYIVAIMMLTAGFKLLFTEGNADRVANARNTIAMAGVGFVISVAGIAAINLISAIFIK